MNCEKSAECGFYKELVRKGAIREGESCGKTNPSSCPRYKFANGIDVLKSQKILGKGRVKNIIAHPLPLSYEEAGIMRTKGLLKIEGSI